MHQAWPLLLLNVSRKPRSRLQQHELHSALAALTLPGRRRRIACVLVEARGRPRTRLVITLRPKATACGRRPATRAPHVSRPVPRMRGRLHARVRLLRGVLGILLLPCVRRGCCRCLLRCRVALLRRGVGCRACMHDACLSTAHRSPQKADRLLGTSPDAA